MSRVRNLVDYQSQTADLDGDATRDLNISGTVTAGAVASANVPDVNLTIAPEVLEIQVDAPDAGQDIMWKWTWEQSTLPYARRTITNSAELNVPLYKEGTYVVNNFAAYDIHGSMTQTHSLYLKWVNGAGTDNLVSWATSAGPISDTHPDINGGNATDVQRITVNVPGTITPPSLTNPSVAYTVTNTASGSYTFSGSASGDNPNLGPFYRGGTYTININATGHPFYFTTDNGTNFSAGAYFGEYTSGVTGSRTDSGTITFTVPAGAPDTLYYQCGNHGVMRGEITVKDLAVETNINGNYVVYFQHTQEGHATPVELRPIPSLVNQMCIVYDAGSGKFVPQDLATYVENTPSFENKIREVAGTAELVVEDGSAVIAKVNVYDDSTYLPLTGNNPGDQAFATDTDILYIWDGSAWQQAGAANSDDLTEGSTNLFFTNARADARIAAATTTDLTEGTNLYYTDARADARVALVVDAAPGTLNTLNELAAALGDDANFSTTVTNSIATKLPLAGGTLTGNVTFGDNNKAIFGAGSDLQIFHNATDSIIADTGDGELRLRTNGAGVRLQSTSDENLANFAINGAVTLYHNNAAKLATTSTGVDITGTLTSDGLTVDGAADFNNGAMFNGNGYNIDLEFDNSGRTTFAFENTSTGTRMWSLTHTNGGLDLNWEPTGGGNFRIGGNIVVTQDQTSRINASITATQGQSTFSATYTVGAIDVFVNGVKLNASEYTATNGTSIVLDESCNANDIFEVNSYGYVNISGAIGSTGNQTIAGNLQVNDLTADNLTAKKLTLTDDGSASPILAVNADDNGPWAAVIKNDTYSTSSNVGLLLHQNDNGQVNITASGSGEYLTGALRVASSGSSVNEIAKWNNSYFTTNRPTHIDHNSTTESNTSTRTAVNTDYGLRIDGILQIPHDDLLMEFDGGQKLMYSNDGDGNFGLKAGYGTDSIVRSSSEYSAAGPSQINMDCDGTNPGLISLAAGPNAANGTTANLTAGIKIDDTGMYAQAPNSSYAGADTPDADNRITNLDRVYGNFICKAYASFNMASSGSIYSEGNVSSVSIQSTGYARMNFATAMPNDDYTVVGDANAHGDGGNSGGLDAGTYVSGPSANQPGTTTWVQYDYREASGGAINKRYASMIVYGEG